MSKWKGMMFAVVFFALPFGVANAGPPLPGDFASCDHQQDMQKVTYGCFEDVIDSLDTGVPGPTGPAGPAGPQGPQGEQGIQGEPGKDGADGKDGRDGLDGRDGVVPSNWYGEMLEFTAANRAAHAYLPQDKDDRLTFGFARAGGRTGVGIGYARMLDREDNLAFTLSVGRAADSVVGNATIGWEF